MSYSIGGNDFSDYNMLITSSIGALDFPRRLGEAEYDWRDEKGMEAYVGTNDMHWDGREIQLMAFYNGSDLDYDLNIFRTTYAGIPSTLITTYGTHTVHLQDITIQQIFQPNGKCILTVKFWEPSVSVPSVPSVVGGSGVKIGGYDFLQDFNLFVAGMTGFYEFRYQKKELTYGVEPAQYSENRDNRKISIHLNGVYSSLANLKTGVNNLHAVLRSKDLKVLTYHGITQDVYFADLARVTTMLSTLMVSVRLPLRIAEAGVDERQLIKMPVKGKIVMPGKGVIKMPK